MAGGVSQPKRPPGPCVPTADTTPNQTLYVSNVNDIIKRQDVVSCLYELCSSYGVVLDIVVSGKNMRGQAFIVFSELSSANTALRALQGREFLGKPLKVAYARTKSDAYLQHIDQYKPRKPNAPRSRVVGADGKVREDVGESNASLFVENIPSNTSKTSLDILFSQYRGFVQTRIIEGREVAFIDFYNNAQADVALQGLQGFKITADHPLRISHVEK